MNLLRVTVLGLACAVPAFSLAQWQWVDKAGRKVYSDQAPPADVPAGNIIKQPGVKSASAVGEPALAAASQSARPAPAAPKLNSRDQELEQKKKRADAAEIEKKKAAAEQVAKVRAESCERAKRSKAAYDSGIRIAQTNAKGEREFMDDATRASEAKRVEGVIASDCNTAGAQ